MSEVVDVIVPVYATSPQLESMARASVAKLREESILHHRVIVIDNGWTEDRDFGQDVYFRFLKNKGYAGGVNAGMSLSDSPIVVVSSIDVFVRGDWELLITAARERNGLATPLAMRWLYGYPDGTYEKPDSDYWGGIMVFPRALFDALGGLDLNFALRHSDTDFAIRAAKAGWPVFRVPVTVDHRDPSISTLLMGKRAVDKELWRLQKTHGEFDMEAWKAADFAAR